MRKKIEKMLDELREQLCDVVNKIEDVWDDLKKDEQREAVNVLFEFQDIIGDVTRELGEDY